MKKRNNNRSNKQRKKSYNLSLQNFYTSKQRIGLTGIDPHLYATLRYSENFSNSVTTTSGAQQIMRLNNLFDPNNTGTGHQPYLYDQYAALYNRYRVLNVKYHVTFGNNTGTYNIVVVPINGSLSSAIAGQLSYETACEQPRAIFKIVPGTGGYPVTVSSYISLNELNGCTTTEYLGDDRFEASINNGPTEIMNLYIGLYNPTLATIIINYTILMEFEVDFHDCISVAGS